MSDPKLELTNLKKHFPIKGGLLNRTKGYVKAVDGISLSIDSGETFALIGESGSGKSTIARTIIGLHEATEGTIRLDGEDITNAEGKKLKRVRSKIQMVFQDPTSSLNPRRPIGSSIAAPLKARNVSSQERQERVVGLLNRVDLSEDYYYKYPNELSGGQKQRINIARALTVDPEVLLLDEPTSALDVSVQAKVIRLLEDLQDELGLTYLFITHDLSLVRNIADRTGVLYLGQIQEKGRTEEVFNRPRHPYSRGLLSSIPVTSEEEEDFKPKKESIEGEIPSPQNTPEGCRFHTRCDYKSDICTQTEPELDEIDLDDRIPSPEVIRSEQNDIPTSNNDNNNINRTKVRCHIYREKFVDNFDMLPKITGKME